MHFAKALISILAFAQTFNVQAHPVAGDSLQKIHRRGIEDELFRAVKYDLNLDVKKILASGNVDVNSRGDYNWTPLLMAAYYNYRTITAYLIDANADVNAQDVWGKTPLAHMVLWKYDSVFDKLIKAGAKVDLPDMQGTTPLMVASTSGNLQMINKLIESGAKVNLVNNIGQSALMFNSMYGTKAINDILISKGANINLVDRNGNTALINAARFAQISIARGLIAGGANIDAKTSYGTALIAAIKANSVDSINFLISKNANPCITNDQNQNAFAIAENSTSDNKALLIEALNKSKIKC